MLFRSPTYQALNWRGLAFDKPSFHSIMDVDRSEALREAEEQAVYFEMFGARLPRELAAQREAFAARASAAPRTWRVAD